MRFLIVLFILLLSGCSVSTYYTAPLSVTGETAYPKLQRIRIERWGDVKFNGILALRGGLTGLHYALIDAMGVTLLKGWSDAGGDHESIKATGALAQKGLGPFLSEVLARIYLREPVKLPCARSGLYSLCVGDEGKGRGHKVAHFAGVAYWSVAGDLNTAKNNSAPTYSPIHYRQPWLGVEIILQKFPKKK